MRAKSSSSERGFSLDYDRPRDSIPVYIAAITPRSIEQTGEIADGIFPSTGPAARSRLCVNSSRWARRAPDRSADAITIAPFTNTYDLDGQDDEQQWRAARQPLFHYINRMGSFYWQMLSHNGFEAEVAASREAWKERDMEGAFDALSEEMVREIQVIGPADSVREQLHERAALGADLQMISMPDGPPAEAGGPSGGPARLAAPGPGNSPLSGTTPLGTQPGRTKRSPAPGSWQPRCVVGNGRAVGPATIQPALPDQTAGHPG